MKFSDLIKASENFTPTEDQKEAFRKRMIEAELKFIQEAKDKEITNEWLNKEYTL